MQNKYIKFLLIALIIAFVIPQITLAAWWNPFSWNIWNYFFHKQTPATQQVPLTAETLRNAIITYPNPYDTSKNDTFTLSGGHTLIHDAGNIKPRAYDVATTTVGDLNGDGVAEGVAGIYQGYGANIIVPIIFVFSDKNGVLTQIDSVLPDTSVWNSETQIKSISINSGILSVNLLVLAEKDQSLPHYQQTPTVAKTVQYKLINGKLVLQPTDQTAGWKTYTNIKYDFSAQYPPDLQLNESNNNGSTIILFSNNWQITVTPKSVESKESLMKFLNISGKDVTSNITVNGQQITKVVLPTKTVVKTFIFFETPSTIYEFIGSETPDFVTFYNSFKLVVQ